MKVKLLINQSAYNQFGCGRRLQFLIQYRYKKTLNHGDEEIYLDPNNGFIRLNKLIDYYNYQGNPNPIWITTIFTPIIIEEVEK